MDKKEMPIAMIILEHKRKRDGEKGKSSRPPSKKSRMKNRDLKEALGAIAVLEAMKKKESKK